MQFEPHKCLLRECKFVCLSKKIRNGFKDYYVNGFKDYCGNYIRPTAIMEKIYLTNSSFPVKKRNTGKL